MVKAKPVSVVIPTFNGSNYIVEQLESILNQSFNEFEIIIVDDNSDDNTVSIIKDYFEHKYFNDYTLIENNFNVGPNKSFEKGIKASEGKYIALSDQDDIWLLSKLETLYKKITEDNLDLVYSPSYLLLENKKTNQIYPIPKLCKSTFCKLKYNNARGATTLIKKEFLESILPFSEYDIYDKWIYFCAIAKGKICFIEEPLNYYRIHQSNLIGKNFKFRSKIELIDKLNKNKNFYSDLLFYLNKNNCNSKFILATKEIINIYKIIISSVQNYNLFRNLKNYFQFIRKKELILKEKLIYFYYMILKFN